MADTVRDLPDDVAAQMVQALDAARDTLLQIEARFHDHGQSHWTGGEGNERPHDRVSAAFGAIWDAAKALSSAGHELTMYRVERAA